MDIQYHYATVSKAIDELRQKGYTEDFNLDENCLVCNSGKFGEEEFDITHIYFYEGETDPGDEATVYGITSNKGHKGILVTGDEQDMDPMANKVINKLLVHRKR